MDVELRGVRGTDPRWVDAATRQELYDALAEAATAQALVDAVVTRCRVALARSAEPGCGHAAADDAEVRRRTGESAVLSRRQRRRAEVAARYGAASEALEQGTIGGEHLDAVVALVPAASAGALEARQQQVFTGAEGRSVDDFCDELRELVEEDERTRGIDRAARQRDRRNGALRRDPRTGMTELRAELDPVRGAPIEARIRAEYRRLLAEDQRDRERRDGVQQGAEPHVMRSNAQRWADAIANAVLSGGPGARSTDDRLPVVVVDRAVLGGGADGECRIPGVDTISPDTARRFACDAKLRIVTHDERGVPVALHTHRRRADAAQRAALATVYDTCAGPGCHVALDDCHFHHIEPFRMTGRSDLHDLIPLCTRCHHMVHEGGWTLSRSSDWVDTWTSPSGATIRDGPPLSRRAPPGSLAARSR